MRPTLLVLAATGLFGATAVQACPACGDKLSIGGGASFERVSQSGPPGRVLVLAAPGSQMQTANSELNLVDEFKRAGYEVRLVGDLNELNHAVHEQGADVVVAHWTDAAAAAGAVGKDASSPTVVSVSYKADDAAAVKAAGAGKCISQAEERKSRKLTGTVGKIIQKRRKGEPADCPVVVASRTR